MSTSRLQRFITAQNQAGVGFGAALAEIQTGTKQGHWIWYVFPQLSGLGASSMSRTYALRDIAEASDYLRDPELAFRLLRITTAVAERVRAGVSLETLMGTPIDVQKLVSSLTLFERVAGRLSARDQREVLASLAHAARDVLAAAAAEGYPPCRYTLEQLGREDAMP